MVLYHVRAYLAASRTAATQQRGWRAQDGGWGQALRELDGDPAQVEGRGLHFETRSNGWLLCPVCLAVGEARLDGDGESNES